MSNTELLAEFELEKKNFNSLQKKGSFSGLAISGRLEEIQELMDSKGIDFEPFYMNITVDIG